MFTILHISDLHRMGGTSVTNEELLSSLIADFQRSSRETPSLTQPDAMVVSGDLVEGLRLGSEVYPDALRNQYQEAEGLLASLVDEFFGGDRSRVVIVPGNHDVDWNGVRKAFETEQYPPENPRGFVNDPESSYRWSWSDQLVFRISAQKVMRVASNISTKCMSAFIGRCHWHILLIPIDRGTVQPGWRQCYRCSLQLVCC